MWRVTLLVWVSARSAMVGCRECCRVRVGCRRWASGTTGTQRRRAVSRRGNGADPTRGLSGTGAGAPG